MAEPVALKYRAFISYSHADTSWAKWLHHALEGFTIDKDLAGRKTATGIIPSALRPIFRDRDDFAAGKPLTEQTLAALDNSEALVVVCSPTSAKSRYVNEEIGLFKSRHPERPVIPLIVAGKPGDAQQECFPPALKFKLDAEGKITSEPEELLAADGREEGDGKYLALAKVIAGLLDISSDEIFRRADRERRAALRRRRRVQAMVAGLALLLAAGSIAWANQDYLREQYYWRVVMGPAVLTPDSERALQPKGNFRECAQGCPEMVVVPAGNFLMGSAADEGEDDEQPQHKVTIAKPFAVSKFELTFDQWDACVAAGGCPRVPDDSWGRGEQPAINISWNDAQQYVTWLSRLTGKPYRLLSEAEWEYAARAGTTTLYSFGDGADEAQIGDYAWYGDNSDQKAHPVGKRKPNAFGLYDVHGNVWEWVADLYHDTYDDAPSDGSARVDGDEESGAVLRGGGWNSISVNIRTAIRALESLDIRDQENGIRVGRTLSLAAPLAPADIKPEPAGKLQDDAVAYLERGIAYAKKGRYDRAIAAYDEAIRLKPDAAEGYLNRGKAYADKREYDRAIADYDAAIWLKPEAADGYLNRGVAHNLKGDTERAIADYDEAIRLNPGVADIYLNRGSLYQQKREFDRAIADYEAAIRLKPDSADGYRWRGLAYSLMGDQDRAIADYDRALALKPDDLYALRWRSLSYGLKNEVDKQLADLGFALKLKPDDADTLIDRGRVLSVKGNHDLAIADFDKVLAAKPDHVRALQNRGWTYAVKGDLDRGLADLDAALRLAPDDLLSLTDRGRLLAVKGKHQAAIADYDKILATNPDNALVLYSRGVSFQQERELDKAAADFNAVLQIAPNDANALASYAILLAEKGDYDAAIATFDKFIQQQPGNLSAILSRGLTYTHKGDYGLAIADFSKVLEAQPDNVIAWNARAWSEARRGNLTAALGDANRALGLNPKEAATLHTRGWIYLAKGEIDLALADFDAALSLNAELVEAYAERGRAYELKGDRDKAIDDYRKAISLKSKSRFDDETKAEATRRLGAIAETPVSESPIAVETGSQAP